MTMKENLEVDVAEEHGKGHWKVPLCSQGYMAVSSLINSFEFISSKKAGKHQRYTGLKLQPLTHQMV